MAEIRNTNQDRDNGIWGELLTQQDNEKDLDRVLQLERETIDTTGNPPAQSMWSTGRGCPKCKRTLMMKELNPETGHLKVFCRCGAEYFSEDLEMTGTINDKIHRQIPDDLVLRWMAARDIQLKMQGR